MNSETITIGFVGDIRLNKHIARLIQGDATLAPCAAMRPIVERLDLAVGNLEFCVSDGRAGGRDHLVILPEDAEAIRLLGFGVFNLANNHVMDLGAAGLTETVKFLESAGIDFFGAGPDIAAAERPLVVSRKGRRIAFLGTCDASLDYAGPKRPGIAPLIRRRLERRVVAARRQADMVVVILHADLEFQRHPAPFRQRLSRRLIDLGATMVIQHHPHVVQGIEHYRGGLIAYSLGNYIFRIRGNAYQEKRPGTSESLLLTVTASFEGDSVWLRANPLPLRIDDDGCPALCDAEDSEARLHALGRLSEEVLDPVLVRRRRFAACRNEFRTLLMSAYYAFDRDGVKAALRIFLKAMGRRQHWPWMIGFLSGGRY